MTMITAAFSRLGDAEAAVAALRAAGFAMDGEVSAPMSPPELEASGEFNSPGAAGAGRGAAQGVLAGSALGAVIGIGTTPFIGPAGVLGGLSVGAYAGSLLGALGGMGTDEEGQEAGEAPDRAPRFVTVHTASAAGRDRARQIMASHSATKVVDHE